MFLRHAWANLLLFMLAMVAAGLPLVSPSTLCRAFGSGGTGSEFGDYMGPILLAAHRGKPDQLLGSNERLGPVACGLDSSLASPFWNPVAKVSGDSLACLRQATLKSSAWCLLSRSTAA